MSTRTNPQTKRTERERHQERGFTLVELLVAISIVGILTAVAAVSVSGLTSTGKKSACATVFSAAQSAATTYYANTNGYPTTFDQLTSGSPPLLSLPAGFTASGKVLSTSTGSVTMSGGGPNVNVPNTYTKAGSCS